MVYFALVVQIILERYGALKGLNATNSQHFGTANFPANIESENS